MTQSAQQIHRAPAPTWLIQAMPANGVLRFDDFMQLALYHPVHGYYSRGEHIFSDQDGPQGDFVTAPELSPLFGQTLGHALRGSVALCGGNLWEFGAGRGKLAAQLLNSLGDEIQRYCIVDVSGGLKEIQLNTLRTLSPNHVHKVSWASQLPNTLQGVVIGNEVLDAMPVRLWRWYSHGVQEVFVRVQTSGAEPMLNFEEQTADAALQAVVTSLHQQFGPWPEGYQSEWGEQAHAFVQTITDKLHGIALMIDYGFPSSEFFHPQRCTGTLVAHSRHQMHDRVLDIVGQQDLTAHVDFTAMYDAQHNARGELLGYSSQAALLLKAGILDIAASTLTQLDPIASVKTKQALNVLLSEAEMGELFKVMAWCKGVEPEQTKLSQCLAAVDRSRQL